MSQSSSKTPDEKKKQVNNILSEYHLLDSESKEIIRSKLINTSCPAKLLQLSLPGIQPKLTIDLSDLGGFVYQDRTTYIKDRQGNTVYRLKTPFSVLTDEILNGRMNNLFFMRKSYILPCSLFKTEQYSDLTSVLIKNIFQTLGINYTPNAEKELRQTLTTYRKRQISQKHEL